MLVSILHRATGTALATAAVIGFVWWLTAASIGAEAYQRFYECATSWVGKVIGIGLTWTFFQHLFSGLRHLVLDTGAGYELRTNRLWATMTIVGSVTATVIVWARSEEHTSELQSLMRISYAVFCLKKKKTHTT